MADSEKLILDITADAKQATKEIDALTKKAEGLEKLDPEVEVQADTKGAEKALDGITADAKKLDQLDPEVTVDADVQRVLTAFEDVVSETKRVATAADALGQALGPELAAKADTVRVIQGLKDMGLTMDQIEGNVDELAAKLKELADNDVGGKLGASLGTARGKVDEMSDSARGANSALANVVGNSTQDLAALGGVAGTAGVALGQIGEYATDATLGGEKLGSALTSMAKVAGPMAALALGVQLVGAYMEGIKVEDTFRAELVDEFTDSIRETGGAIQSMNEKFTDTGKIEFVQSGTGLLGLGKAVKDLVPIAAQYHVTVQDFIDFSQQGADAQERFAFAVTGATSLYGDGERSQAARNLLDALDQYGDSTDAAAQAVEDFNAVNVVSAQTAKSAFDAWTKLQDPVGQFPEEFDRMAKAMADGTAPAAKDLETTTEGLGLSLGEVISLAGDLSKKLGGTDKSLKAAADGLEVWADATAHAVEGMDAYDKTLQGMDWGEADLAGATSAMSKFTESHFALKDIAADSEAAMDGFSQSIKDNGKSFDVSTEKGRANQSALEDVAKTLDTKLAAAYDDANGDMDVFRTKAGAISKDAVDKLMPALKGSGLSAEDLADMLGLLPEDIETRYKLSGDEEAKLKLGFLQTAIDNLPEDVQTQVTQKILVGDWQGALAIVQGHYNQNPAELGTDVKAPPNAEMAHIADLVEAYYRNHPVNVKLTPLVGRYEEGGTVGREGGIGGEAGPEFAEWKGRRVLLLGPTALRPGTKVTSAVRTKAILRRRGGRAVPTYADGTGSSAAMLTAAAGPMTFQFHQHAPIYGVADLDAHLESWSQRLAQQISVGRRS